jgi:hypothetical protein
MQLQKLEQLSLHSVMLVPAQDSSSSSSSVAGHALGPVPLRLSDLPALTSLKLTYCAVPVEGFANATGLQELSLRCGSGQPTGAAQQTAARLAQALPALQDLT